ncbi:protease HtpX [Myxococcota bacterium]|nr:protease HtpX [Myxococcota bacterium]
MSRIGLFLLTNLAVVFLLGLVTRVFGLDQWLVANGVSYGPLLVMSAMFGFVGSFISLALSKWMALRTTGAQVIDQPRNEVEAWLLATVQRQAQAAGIGMPTVAIYPSDTPNAFATGARRDAALVAVSSGLLRGMTRREVEAVLAHEVSHVANGDMVTLTLIQGVVNTFVIFLSRVVGGIVDKAVFRTERGWGPGYWITVMALELVFGLLASTIVMWFSRRREFRADAGAARIEGKDAMISALLRLGQGAPSELPQGMQAMGIKGGKARALFSSHPSIEDRVMALEKLQL